ncbi:conserved hypothetical protein [uncultured Desulfobacterium sp.]|uniref:Methyltransferase domain-containing protein n=1 Tax=uncultured Desulfobacterium sp. TaxID=201089 RepID=A0A445MVF9_9BACT|nr:conserved hypothetical protein [uncultured Desulfobacterium sp.]
MAVIDEDHQKALEEVALFYDERKVGDVGPLGFRRSTDLLRLSACLPGLLESRVIEPGKTRFLDLGCADGRVNVFLSYMVDISVGVELDDWTLDEYGPLRSGLDRVLKEKGLLSLPENTFLFHGDSTDDRVHKTIKDKTGVRFDEFDLFYTYLVMHQEFAELIGRKAKKGAVFMVYGVSSIMPRYDGFRLLEDISPMEGILALYEKIL